MQPALPIVCLNGTFVSRHQAAVDIEDRGLMFADGVYEVTRYYGGRALAADAHLARLQRSLEAVGIDGADVSVLPALSDELLQRCETRDAAVYWKITRGTAPRNRAIPDGQLAPTVLVMGWPMPRLDEAGTLRSQRFALVPDRRWDRCHIKSLMLLDNVLSKREAEQRGFDDAIYHRRHMVTESTAMNVLMVRDGVLWTPPTDHTILAGITRMLVLELADELGIPVREQPFTTDALLQADEAMVTSTTTHITAVSRIEDRELAIGPVTTALHEALLMRIARDCLASDPAPAER